MRFFQRFRRIKGLGRLKEIFHFKKVKVIFNPISGKGEAKKTLSKIKKALSRLEKYLKFDLSFTREEQDACKLAKEAADKNYELVIVAGGDGTINEVIQSLVNTDVALGIIPLGTGNILAQELGIPSNVDIACELLARSEKVKVDLGKCNDKYFIWMAGIGGDAESAYLANKVKYRMNVVAYVRLGLEQLKKVKPLNFEVEVDGRRIKQKALNIFIGNCCSFYDGKKLNIKSTEAIRDGTLNICFYRKFSSMAILRALARVALGDHTYYSDLRYSKYIHLIGKNIKVASDEGCYIHADGEIVSKTPANFEIVPSSLYLMMPQII